MSDKFIKRPLLFANLLIAGFTMIIVNCFYSAADFPKEKMTEGLITGRICGIENKGAYTDVILKDVEFGNENSFTADFMKESMVFRHFKARCSIISDAENLKMGQCVVISGKFGLFDTKTNPGQFDSRKYYISKGILLKGSSCEVIAKAERYSRFFDCLRRIREYGLELLDEALDEKDAGLMKAILLADKSDIDAETKEMYQTAGAAHILAISGLHISLFGAGILFLMNLFPISKKVSYTVAAGVLFLYGIMIGFSPSSMRAIIMFSILCFGKLKKRSYDPLTAMSFAAVVTLFLHPFSCLNSGFLLSYLAIIGLSVIAPAFNSVSKKKQPLFESVKSSLSVSLYTLPVIMNTYFKVPLYSVFLNLIIVPGMSVIICAGIASMIWEAIFPRIYNIFSLAIHLIFVLYEVLIGLTLKLPFSSVLTGERSISKCLVYLSGITVLFMLSDKTDIEFYRKRKILANQKRRYPSRNISLETNNLKRKGHMLRIVTIVLTLMCVMFLLVDTKKDYVAFLDVGQGLCVVMNIDGKAYCYDGGSSDKREVWKYVIKPYLESQKIGAVELWFLSHSDNDHTSGLKEALTDDDITVKRICLSDCYDEKAEEIKKLAKDNGTKVYTASKGQTIGGKNIDFEVLAPTSLGYKNAEANENSLVVLAKTEGGNILLMGDAGVEAEKDIAKANCRISIYQAAHHGSAQASNSESFIEAISPSASVVSCGFGNPYNHPHKETIERLSKYSGVYFRTDESGSIQVMIEDNVLRIKSFTE